MNDLRKAIRIIECWNTINLTNKIQVCDEKIKFVIPCIHKFESYRTIFFSTAKKFICPNLLLLQSTLKLNSFCISINVIEMQISFSHYCKIHLQ